MNSQMAGAHVAHVDDLYTAVVATIAARELARDLTVAERDASTQHAQTASLSTKLSSLVLAHDDAITKLEKSKTAEETTARAVAALQVQVDDLVVRFDALKSSQHATLTRMQERLAMARTEKSQQRETAEVAVQARDRVKDLLILEKDRAQSLETEKEEVTAQKRLVEADVAELERSLSTLNDGLRREKIITGRLEGEKQAVVHQCEEQRQHYEALVETSRLQLDGVKGDLSRHKDRVHSFESERMAVNDRLAKIESAKGRLEGLLQSSKDQSQTLFADLEESNKTVSGLRGEVRRLTFEQNSQRVAMAERDGTIGQLDHDNRSLRKANTSLMAEVAQSKRANSQARTQLRELQQSNQILTERSSHAEAMAAKVQTDVERLTSINEKHVETISKVKMARDELGDAFRCAREENCIAHQHLQASEARQGQLAAEVDNLQNANTELNARLSDARQREADLWINAEAVVGALFEEKLDHARRTIVGLQDQVSGLNEKAGDLHDEVDELTEEVASLTRRRRSTSTSWSSVPTIHGFNDSDGEMRPAVLGRSYRVR
ncbi:hypothetical protein LTR97_012032 [Elasticomyces elasticus]|uniref:Uncharacterized protein n=1 Tax=Elasticomyces elasticus TaxID=574655 RepID=A0AAN7VXX8_9PEZI|nr:hypothetical protein LTR97_012032 [Elasticomyces elasticus]